MCEGVVGTDSPVVSRRSGVTVRPRRRRRAMPSTGEHQAPLWAAVAAHPINVEIEQRGAARNLDEPRAVPFLGSAFASSFWFMHGRFSLRCLFVCLAFLAGSPVNARAANVGLASDALPGLHRVPLAEPSDSRVMGALTVGYGVTAATASESGSHQRISTALAVGVAPLPRLQFALSAAGRYDHHPSDAQGRDSGTVLDPRLSARWVQPWSEVATLGFELGAWFPGSEDASRTLGATSPHAALLATLRWGLLSVGVRGGYRLDRSAKARPELAQLRAGDRLALGLSDSNAALLGVGFAYPVGDVQLLAESSAELLVGEAAPPLHQSPIGASAGARYAVNEQWSLELLGEASFSGRPALEPGDPLVPVQPRFAAFAGVRFSLPVAAPVVAAAPEREPEAAPALIDLRVEVASPLPDDGVAIHATLEQSGKSLTATRNGAGELSFSGVVPGLATLSLVAEGYERSQRSVRIEVAGARAQRVRVTLTALPRAQLRGLVRSFGGQGLPARVRVEPLGIEAATDGDGFFELDVPAGRYEVSIQAAGYRPQQKSVVVEKDGVVILNADLLKEP
jgi:hypothetical protein